MALNDIAMEPGAIIDAQHTAHAPYDAANDTANNRSDRASIVLTDASAVSGAIWQALSVCCSRHGKCHGGTEYDVSNHGYL